MMYHVSWYGLRGQDMEEEKEAIGVVVVGDRWK